MWLHTAKIIESVVTIEVRMTKKLKLVAKESQSQRLYLFYEHISVYLN